MRENVMVSVPGVAVLTAAPTPAALPAAAGPGRHRLLGPLCSRGCCCQQRLLLLLAQRPVFGELQGVAAAAAVDATGSSTHGCTRNTQSATASAAVCLSAYSM